MSDCTKNVALALLLACFAPLLPAQKETEMFIPVGQSPGLSGKHTLLGRVLSLSTAEGMLTLADAAATRNVRIGPQTSIWVDRSKLQLPNKKGTMADLRKDLLVEVKYRGNDRESGVAEWIKVQALE